MEHLSITFPRDLQQELDREAKREHTKRSTLIQKAVRVYLELKQRKALHTLLKEGYVEMAGEARQLLHDFEHLDRESRKYAD